MTEPRGLDAVNVRIASVEKDYLELKAVVVNLDHKIDRQFQAITAKLDEKNKTPWGVIYTGLGLVLSVCIAIGGLAYMPIKSDIERMREAQIRDVDALIRRDQRLWDSVLDSRDRIRLIEGRMSVK